MNRKLIVFIACSIDGYIAGPGDDLSFLDTVANEGEDYGYAAFYETVDTVIMGRKTYDWVLKHGEYPHRNKYSYIITRTPKPAIENLNFYTGELSTLVTELKGNPGKHIYCDGGAEIVNLLFQERLIDEMIISIIPVLLGGGTRLFQEGFQKQKVTLLNEKSFSTGLVQLHYTFNK